MSLRDQDTAPGGSDERPVQHIFLAGSLYTYCGRKASTLKRAGSYDALMATRGRVRGCKRCIAGHRNWHERWRANVA